MSIQKARNGECPNCGSNDLDYESIEPIDNKQIFYPFTCNNCDAEGRETWGLIDGETEIEQDDLQSEINKMQAVDDIRADLQ